MNVIFMKCIGYLVLIGAASWLLIDSTAGDAIASRQANCERLHSQIVSDTDVELFDRACPAYFEVAAGE